MTAGHCCHDITEHTKNTVEVGLHKRSNDTEFQTTRSKHLVKEKHRHPDFKSVGGHNEYDFTILELEKAIDMRPEAKAISLPSATDTVFDEDTVFVTSGWGHLRSHGEGSDALRSVSLPWVPQQICREDYKKFGDKITDDMICAGNEKEGQIDSCQNDSGGKGLNFGDALLIIYFTTIHVTFRSPCLA